MTPARIFPAAERGHTESDWFRSYCSFHSGAYRPAGREPFGALYVFNEDTLAAGHRSSGEVAEDTLLVLLPLGGVVAYSDSCGRTALLRAGEVQSFRLRPGNAFTVANPSDGPLAQYLQLWLRCPPLPERQGAAYAFDMAFQRNELLHLGTLAQGPWFARLLIGRYEGRAEDTYRLSRPGHRLFVFILEGAFEVQGRLLEPRDGLALWDLEALEFEALSNDAILLVTELGS